MRALIASLAMLALASCKGDKDASDASKQAAEVATPAAEGKGEEPAQKSASAKLLGWLDPDAVAVAYSRLGPDIDADALGVVFALPPRATRMLTDAAELTDDLDAVIDPEAPRPDTWLGPEVLAMSPVVSAGNYLVRELTKPRAEVEAILAAADLETQEVEGFKILVSRGAFPWKVAFLSDDVVAFIPKKEIGSGLGPLTAGRDLPPSDLERELQKSLEQDGAAVLLEMFHAGPLLHLNLEQDVNGIRFGLRKFKNRGMDGLVLLETAEDPATAAKTLEDRKEPLETDTIQALVERVAYTVDGPMVSGRLQLLADDVDALRQVD